MRLLHHCGMPAEDVDFINSDGKTMNKLLSEVRPYNIFCALYQIQALLGYSTIKLAVLHPAISFTQAKPRMTLFTGSSRVAEKLAVDLNGRIKLEDAGFDWKILGPDVHEVTITNFRLRRFL